MNELMAALSLVNNSYFATIDEDNNLISVDDNSVEAIDVQGAMLINTTGGSSKGYQPKWLIGNKFVKLDTLGYESLAEITASWFMSNIKSDIKFVKYYPCVIFKGHKKLGYGCYSIDFRDGNNEISLLKIMQNLMLDVNISYDDLRFELIKELGVDIKPELDKMLCVDSILRNEDRHFRNISLLDKGGKFELSPIFDTGDSLLSDLHNYPLKDDLSGYLEHTHAKPFYTDYKRQLSMNERLLINPEELFEKFKISNIYSERIKAVLEYGLKDMEGIAWQRY